MESDSETKSVHPTHTQQLLTPLRESITNKPPFISGTLPLPVSCFSLFYRTTEGGPNARRIDLANATFDELKQLAEACGPTKKAMMDAPAKMDLGSFAPLLVPVQTNLAKVIRDYHFEGDMSSQRLRIDLRGLNVYSKGSFSKPRIEAPPDKRMLGTLMIIFPTPHEGGAMTLRSGASHEWSFDPSPETSNKHTPSIGYVVLFKDVEHEVAPVTSGHRVTLTYDLYAENDGGAVSTNGQQASESVLPLMHKRAFHDVFTELLENQEFLADDGGTLAFGLAHAYSIEKDFKYIYGALKGSDAIVYWTLRELGFEPVLRMYYNEWKPYWAGESLNGHAAVFDKIVDFSAACYRQSDDIFMPDVVEWLGGQLARSEDLQTEQEYRYEEDAEVVAWVTPVTTFNRKESAFGSPDVKFAETNVAYGDLCLFARIGRAGERLSYSRVAQSKSKSENKATSSDSESQGSEV